MKDLSQLYWLNREIELDAERLAELQTAAAACTAKLTGMPGAHNAMDKIGEYAAEIADLRGIIEAKIRQCVFLRNRIERYICTVPDSEMRQLMIYRFVQGLPWRDVARRMGSGFTAEAVRQSVRRYVNQRP